MLICTQTSVLPRHSWERHNRAGGQSTLRKQTSQAQLAVAQEWDRKWLRWPSRGRAEGTGSQPLPLSAITQGTFKIMDSWVLSLVNLSYWSEVKPGCEGGFTKQSGRCFALDWLGPPDPLRSWAAHINPHNQDFLGSSSLRRLNRFTNGPTAGMLVQPGPEVGSTWQPKPSCWPRVFHLAPSPPPLNGYMHNPKRMMFGTAFLLSKVCLLGANSQEERPTMRLRRPPGERCVLWSESLTIPIYKPWKHGQQKNGSL